jgi:hypothetical protein
MPLLDGDPLREQERVRSLIPPTPGLPVPEATAMQLPANYVMHVAESVARRRARAHRQFLEDGPESVIDLHSYEEVLSFTALLREIARDFTGSAAAEQSDAVAALRERERQWAEAGRALAAANGVSIG